MTAKEAMERKNCGIRKGRTGMRYWLKRFLKEEDGIGTVEMILILVVKCTPYMDVY